MYSIQLGQKILILAIVFLQCLQQSINMPQTESHHRVIFPKAVPIIRVCDGKMVCMPLSSCRRTLEGAGQAETAHKNANPSICGWEVTEPRVCCNSSATKVEPQQPQVKQTNQNLIAKEECAKQKEDSSIRLKREFHITVIDGEDVPSNEKYPFIVGIYIRLGMDKIFLCGGSLLSKGMVLTAAHCFDNRIESDTYVLKMGSINFQPNNDVSSDVELNATEVIIHPDYRTPQLYHDVAVLKFSGLESYTKTIQPICLPDSDLDTLRASVIGWGSTEFGGSSSSILQEALIPIVPNTECNGTFWSIGTTRSSLPRGIIPSVICAGDKNSSKDACQGDSGGPLVFAESATSRWTQVGIVSGGIGCGTPGIPGIYTRVSDYVEWIHSKL